MEISGTILKMETVFSNPVEYFLPVGNEKVGMNELIGKTVSLTFLNEIRCVGCGAITKKSFAQGYCYSCLLTLPETDDCVLRPELCKAHLGISRDMQWSESHCLQEHYVYLAVSSDLKVGVTRKSQIPTRWIDQGASYAIKFARTPNRYLAGCIEVDLKKYVSDKTSWQKMLRNLLPHDIDLFAEKNRIAKLLNPDYHQYISNENEIYTIFYPNTITADKTKKVTSLSFDTKKEIKGILTGIKGQYLLFDDNSVINMRKHAGYKIVMNW